MNLIWQDYLQSQNAVIENDCVAHHGDFIAELKHTQSATAMMDLSHFGLICFSGEDVQAFLQGQLSCDVNKMNVQTLQFGSYCTPKGRMLATFWLWKYEDTYLMQLPQSLCAGVLKRLSMFVLRAKVKLDGCSPQLVRIGVVGNNAGTLIEEILAKKLVVDKSFYTIQNQAITILCYTPNRFELVVPIEQAPELWARLSKQAKPVASACWDWLDIRTGFPVVLPETQQQFVPQMTNLDLINGVSFQKGCYPGQEIVARTQHLGKIKRRMYLANIATTNPVMVGDELFSVDQTDQACGKIVNAMRSPDGGFDVLAVISIENMKTSEIFWRSIDGIQLKMAALPYALD